MQFNWSNNYQTFSKYISAQSPSHSIYFETPTLPIFWKFEQVAFEEDSIREVSKYWVFSGLSVSLRIHSKCGKIETRKNPVFGHL